MKNLDSFLSTVRQVFRFPGQVEVVAIRVLQKLSYDVEEGDVRFSHNILYLQNIPSVLKAHIIRDKEKILSLIREEIGESGYTVKDLC